MDRQRVSLISFLLMGLSLPSVFGCFCQPAHPQQQFCNADAVIVGTVQTKQLLSGPPHPSIPVGQPTTITYNVHVNRIKKGRQHISQLWHAQSNMLALNTTATNTSCGVPWLQVGQQYVLTVTVVNGKASILYCHFHRVNSDLSPTQRRGINSAYNANCASCQVDTCRGRCPLTPSDDTTCRHGNGQSHEDCYYHHGICRVKSSGKCGWKRSDTLDTCLQQRNQIV